MSMENWIAVLVVIGVLDIVTAVVALFMFITFRQTATMRLDEQREVLAEMRDAIDIVKRHSELAREAKADTKAALCEIRAETTKTATAAVVAAEKVEQVVTDTAKKLADLQTVVMQAVPAQT